MKGWRLKWRSLTLVLMIIGIAPALGAGTQQNRYTVLVDPAHGGDESGVIADQLQEKDLTLKLAMLIRQEAQKNANFQVQVTRSADRTMTVLERNKAVDALKPDCFLSLHINAGFGKKAAGYEVYFPGFRQTTTGGGDSTIILKDMEKNSYLNDSVRLAQQIQAGLETVFPRRGRGLRDAPSPLLDALTITGLIVEIGFATQTEDRKKLTDNETQKAVARALVMGLRDYFQKVP
jgi:N-acetylmuramoyl-L-alanine amidase